MPNIALRILASCFASIGVNISERKSGIERTKKRKKRELVYFPPPGGATGTVVGDTSSRKFYTIR